MALSRIMSGVGLVVPEVPARGHPQLGWDEGSLVRSELGCPVGEGAGLPLAQRLLPRPLPPARLWKRDLVGGAAIGSVHQPRRAALWPLRSSSLPPSLARRARRLAGSPEHKVKLFSSGSRSHSARTEAPYVLGCKRRCPERSQGHLPWRGGGCLRAQTHPDCYWGCVCVGGRPLDQIVAGGAGGEGSQR